MIGVTHFRSFRIETEPKGKRQVIKAGVVHVRTYDGVSPTLYGYDARSLGMGVGGYARTAEDAVKQALAAFGFRADRIEPVA